MNYKSETSNFLDQNSFMEVPKSEVYDDQNEDSNSILNDIIKFFNPNFTDEEFNEFLTKLNDCHMPILILQKEETFQLFQKQDLNIYMIEYLFSERPQSSNYELIFRILLSLMDSKFFIKFYTESGFVQSFIENITKFDVKTCLAGCAAINKIVLLLDKSKIMELITPEIFEYLMSIFPTEIEYIDLIESFSFLFSLLITKIDGIQNDWIEIILEKIFLVFETEQNEIYFNSISKILLKLLENGFEMKQFKQKYFKRLNRCYNFSGIEGKITIFSIYERIINQSNSKFAYFLFNQHSSTLFNDLIDVPSRRESILMFILTFIRKDIDHIESILNSHIIEIVLRTQDDLSYNCLNLVCQLIDILVNNNYADQPNMMKILLKMLHCEDDEMIKHIFTLINSIRLFMDTRGKLSEIKEEFCACDGIDTLTDLAMNYQEAQTILDSFGLNSIK